MQKYVYGCYSAGTRKDGRLDRHIELTTDMRFAVVNHNTSDDVLKEHDEIYGLWRIDEVRKDKKGKDFLICSLARALTVEEVDMLTKKWCYVISIMDALTKPIDEKDEDWKNKVAGYTMGDMTRTTLYRMLYGAGIEGDFETARDELFSRFVEGKVSLQTLMEYANTTIMSSPKTAKLHPMYELRVGRQLVNDIYFVDENNADCEGNVVRIDKWNHMFWKDCLPLGIRLKSANTHLYLNMDLALFDFSLPKDEACNYYGIYQNCNFTFMAAPKNGDEPFKVVFGVQNKDDALLKQVMEEAGLSLHNGQYVPKGMPDWRLVGYENGKQSLKPNMTVHVRFSNHMEGYYSIAYLMKRYGGKCLNARFTVSGSTAETLTINVEMI